MLTRPRPSRLGLARNDSRLVPRAAFSRPRIRASQSAQLITPKRSTIKSLFMFNFPVMLLAFKRSQYTPSSPCPEP